MSASQLKISVAFCLFLCVVSATHGDNSGLVTVPFAEASVWAAQLQDLRVCDNGVDDDAGCPGRPEHGGAGFLSTVFTWRYALNNLRGALSAVAADEVPEGVGDVVMNLLIAFDRLMERPMLHTFAELTRTVRSLFDDIHWFLAKQPPVVMRLRPAKKIPTPRHWTLPSDGRTPVRDAVFVLRTGARMPAIGFGTWRLWGQQAYQPVRWALETGIRHIDTAEGYANEAEIGRAIHDSGVRREDLFITTKASSVPKGLNDVDRTVEIFNMQLAQLGTDYVDVYMLHTPPDDLDQLRAVWRELEGLYEHGRVKALGVSNCIVKDLKELYKFARIPPAYIQNLFKIYKPGEQMLTLDQTMDIVMFAQLHDIAVMGYSVQTEWPNIMSPLQDPHVLSIATKIRRTPSQVLHRWALQRGVGVIPKSSSKKRIEENAQLLDFELNEDAMRLLDGLATLSESSATLRPHNQEDVFELFSRTTEPDHTSSEQSASELRPPEQKASSNRPAREQNQGRQKKASPVPAVPASSESTSAATNLHSSDLLEQTQNKGFPFTEVRPFLFGPPVNVTPTTCRQLCLGEPRCAAWEVCAPYDPQRGCGGCYFLTTGSVPIVEIKGWHAAIERRGR